MYLAFVLIKRVIDRLVLLLLASDMQRLETWKHSRKRCKEKREITRSDEDDEVFKSLVDDDPSVSVKIVRHFVKDRSIDRTFFSRRHNRVPKRIRVSTSRRRCSRFANSNQRRVIVVRSP